MCAVTLHHKHLSCRPVNKGVHCKNLLMPHTAVYPLFWQMLEDKSKSVENRFVLKLLNTELVDSYSIRSASPTPLSVRDNRIKIVFPLHLIHQRHTHTR